MAGTLDQQNIVNDGAATAGSAAGSLYNSTGITIGQEGSLSQIDLYLYKQGDGGDECAGGDMWQGSPSRCSFIIHQEI